MVNLIDLTKILLNFIEVIIGYVCLKTDFLMKKDFPKIYQGIILSLLANKECLSPESSLVNRTFYIQFKLNENECLYIN